MSRPDSSAISPKVWIAVIGVLGTAAVGLVTLIIGLLTIAGLLVTYGGWKSQVDLRMTTMETTSKEQITALASNTDKQIVLLTSSCKEMVTAMGQTLGQQIKDIEQDRKVHITEAEHWREEHGAEITTLKTIVTQQQRQIDLLTDSNTQRPARR